MPCSYPIRGVPDECWASFVILLLVYDLAPLWQREGNAYSSNSCLNVPMFPEPP